MTDRRNPWTRECPAAKIACCAMCWRSGRISIRDKAFMRLPDGDAEAYGRSARPWSARRRVRRARRQAGRLCQRLAAEQRRHGAHLVRDQLALRRGLCADQHRLSRQCVAHVIANGGAELADCRLRPEWIGSRTSIAAAAAGRLSLPAAGDTPSGNGICSRSKNSTLIRRPCRR